MAAAAALPPDWDSALATLASASDDESSGYEPPALIGWSFEEDCVLPVQWYSRRHTGAERLLLTVFWGALWDLRHDHGTDPCTCSRLRKERRSAAREYFTLPGGSDVVRFHSRQRVNASWVRAFDAAFICEHFGWDLDAIRKALGQLRLVDSVWNHRGGTRRGRKDYKGTRQRRLIGNQ